MDLVGHTHDNQQKQGEKLLDIAQYLHCLHLRVSLRASRPATPPEFRSQEAATSNSVQPKR